MKIAVTGANGFVGKNLRVFLSERGFKDVACLTRESTDADWHAAMSDADFVFHLAGVNRPKREEEFAEGNGGLTEKLCDILEKQNRKTPVVYTSSTQAEKDNPYGRSKRAAEDRLKTYSAKTGARVHIFRLPNVFGKWCRPDYNSAVATFCHRIAHGQKIEIHDPNAVVNLVYIDDVAETFLGLLSSDPASHSAEVRPVYTTTVGAMAKQIEAFRDSRTNMITEPVGTGFVRALYATYITYLDPADFAYPLVKHEDPRGMFVEMLKTKDSGQFSFFTAHPGITRGGHYHHTKSEKFLVIQGKARFRFRHLMTNATYEIDTSGDAPQVVETIPGWSHDITNVGGDTLIVMLWANEIFDRNKPDTVTYAV